jgi:hypothetical protein
VLLVTASQALAWAASTPINKVPVLTALMTKASTVPSTSASLLCALRLAKVTVIWLSSLPVATVVVKALKVGPISAGSLTQVALTGYGYLY